MSYTVVNPGAKPRPGAVTAASALLYLAALSQLASIGLSVMTLGPVRQILDEEFADTPDADAVGTAMTVGIIVAIAVSVLFVVGTAVLGLLVGKGKNPARIVTWVLAGIGVLCYGCNLAGTAVSGALTGSINGDPESADIQRRIEDAIPAWQNAASTGLSILMLVALLAVIILLALPASNDFFRKEQEVWTPPTWPAEGGGYPPVPPPPAPPAPPTP